MFTLRKRTATAAISAGLVAALAACGAATPAAGAHAASMWSLTGGAEPLVRAQVLAWNDANPDRQIDHELFANDVFGERIRTAVGSDMAPTLIHSWAGGPLREYVENAQVVDLSAHADQLLAGVIPSVAANGVVDGNQYAVPNGQSQPVTFFYNREVFEKAGITEIPETLDALHQAVRDLQDAGVDTPISLAAGSRWPLLMWIQYFADRIGGPEMFEAVVAGEEGAWSNPHMIRALEEIVNLVDMGAFGTGFGSVMADGQADLALVSTGRAAMVLHLASAVPNFMSNAPEFIESGNLGFFAFPSVDGGLGDPQNIVGNPSHFWSISAAESPEAQQVGIDFITDKVFSEAHLDAMLGEGAVPPIQGIRDRFEGKPNQDFMEFTYDLLVNAPHFQLSWDQALDGARAQALLENLSSLFLGSITPEQFAATMDTHQ